MALPYPGAPPALSVCESPVCDPTGSYFYFLLALELADAEADADAEAPLLAEEEALALGLAEALGGSGL